jgi:hypothetical protein
MSTLRLPTFRTDFDHRYNIVLDGVTVILEFHYNRRADRWNVHFFDVNSTPIRHGIRLVIGIDLLQRVALRLQPPGQFTVVDTTEADIEPDGNTLGVECQFRYIEEADL